MDRHDAAACMASNLMVFPGVGSLAAGRGSGYGHVILAFIGTAATVFGGWRAVSQYFRTEEPGLEFWRNMAVALAGMFVFGTGWLWALATSLDIMKEAKSGSETPPPSG
jgi:hypothetical protein